MSKKNFTTDADDIFGDYAKPKSNGNAATIEKEKTTKTALEVREGEYEMYLMPMEKGLLEKARKLAKENKLEIKDVVATALTDYLSK